LRDCSAFVFSDRQPKKKKKMEEEEEEKKVLQNFGNHLPSDRVLDPK
jgi:hypothetical protein